MNQINSLQQFCYDSQGRVVDRRLYPGSLFSSPDFYSPQQNEVTLSQRSVVDGGTFWPFFSSPLAIIFPAQQKDKGVYCMSIPLFYLHQFFPLSLHHRIVGLGLK